MSDFSKGFTFVFDLDNTLVETDFANSISYLEAIKKVLNIDLCFDFQQRFTREDIMSSFPNLAKNKYDEVVSAKKDIFASHIVDTKLNENLVNILRTLHHNNCETILLTNSHRERAVHICEYYDLAKYFTCSYYSEDKIRSKYDVLKRKGYDMNSIILFET